MSDGTITIGQASRLLGVTTARIRQLIAEGYVARTERGRVPIVSAVQGFIRAHQDSQARADKRHAEGARVRNARADEIELRVAVERENLIERADAEAAMEFVVEVTKAELATVPRRLDGTTADRHAAKELVRAAMTAIDRSLARQIDNLRTGDF